MFSFSTQPSENERSFGSRSQGAEPSGPCKAPVNAVIQDTHTVPTPRLTCRGWSVSALCANYPNFREIRRIKASALFQELQQVLDDYERKGEPLIVEGLHQHPKWREELLSIDWFLQNMSETDIHVRNVYNRKDRAMSLANFIRTSRGKAKYSAPGETERLYWKDADCPTEWRQWLAELLPGELLPGCSSDLLRNLSSSEAVESLMCYLGIGDTFTAAHKDLCSSSGHNLMCFAENGGSSFWFMTESNTASQAAEWFQKELGEELDWETRVTTVEELGKAPFTIYIAEQKVGDLVLVPPRSVHQVVNQGGLAIKASWSRMTLLGLKSALHHELPVYHRVCRPEQYRVKTVLYRTMLHHTGQLQSALQSQGDLNLMRVDDCFQELLDVIELFDEVLVQEYASCHNQLDRVNGFSDSSGWSMQSSNTRRLKLIPPRDACDRMNKHRNSACNFACDFCGADIFQSFFECPSCLASPDEFRQPGDGLLICPTCYVEGRSCVCDNMVPRQCRPLQVLIDDRNRAADALRQVAQGNSPKPLQPRDLEEGDCKAACVFNAACSYQQLKVVCVQKGQTERTCRPGARTLEHTTSPFSCLPCAVCKVSKCFRHLLLSGTHAVEALIAHGKGGAELHHTHMSNAVSLKQFPPTLHSVLGSNAKHRLFVAARSFPRCIPLSQNLTRVGFYDEECEDNADSGSEVTSSPMVGSRLLTLSQEAFEGEMSPLPEDFEDLTLSSGSCLVSAKPSPNQIGGERSPSVSHAVTAIDAKPETNLSKGSSRLLKVRPQRMAYVEISKRGFINKRTSLDRSEEVGWGTLHGKPRLARLDTTMRGRFSGRGGARHPTLSNVEADYVDEDYGNDLASALSVSQGRPYPIGPPKRRRIVYPQLPRTNRTMPSNTEGSTRKRKRDQDDAPKRQRPQSHVGQNDIEIVEIDAGPISIEASHLAPRRSSSLLTNHPQPAMCGPSLSQATTGPSAAAIGALNPVEIQVTSQQFIAKSHLTEIPSAQLPEVAPTASLQTVTASTNAAPGPSRLIHMDAVNDESSISDPAECSADTVFNQMMANLVPLARSAATHVARHAEARSNEHMIMQTLRELKGQVASMEATHRSFYEYREHYEKQYAELLERYDKREETVASMFEALKKERSELALISSKLRECQEQHKDFLKAEQVHKMINKGVQDNISSLMPRLRDSMNEMITQHDHTMSSLVRQTQIRMDGHPPDPSAQHPSPQSVSFNWQDRSDHPLNQQHGGRSRFPPFSNSGRPALHQNSGHNKRSGPFGQGGPPNQWQQNGGPPNNMQHYDNRPDRWQHNRPSPNGWSQKRPPPASNWQQNCLPLNNWQNVPPSNLRQQNVKDCSDRPVSPLKDHDRQLDYCQSYTDSQYPQELVKRDEHRSGHEREISVYSTHRREGRSPSVTTSYSTNYAGDERPSRSRSINRHSEASIRIRDVSHTRSTASVHSEKEHTPQRPRRSPLDRQESFHTRNSKYQHACSSEESYRQRRSRSPDYAQLGRRSQSRDDTQSSCRRSQSRDRKTPRRRSQSPSLNERPCSPFPLPITSRQQTIIVEHLAQGKRPVRQ